MADFKIRKGYDLPLAGAPERTLEEAPAAHTVAIRPSEFRRIKPKVLVKDGDKVSAGQPLFRCRKRPELHFVSPGGGEVVEVRYGRRRVCEEIFIRLSDSESWVEGQVWSPADARNLAREQIVERLLDSGMWTSLRTRPFSIVPDADSVPEAIFIAASDSSPLPFASDLALGGREEDFQLGIDLLGKLTEGKVHLCLARGGATGALGSATGCEKHTFSGPYPSGQIEAQIHHVLPYRKGREVWFLDCQDVAGIGELFRTGRYPVTWVVAVGGDGATARRHFRTRRGISADQLDPQASPAESRFVSGNVFSGRQVSSSCGLGHYDNKFSVIPEGDQPEFIGWMLPGFEKVSRFRAYASAMIPQKSVHMNTGLGGGVRAHVATGIYEDVCAVDILPSYLMKSILIQDIEEQVSLGIHDCAECGLCTFVCPSKIEFGEIIDRGIDEFMQEEEG